jgi:glutathione S-transferase
MSAEELSAFQKLNDAYRALNPYGRVPTLVEVAFDCD